MSDNDNYWSDENESETELVQDSRDLPPLEIDSEEEEEYNDMLQFVLSKTNKDIDSNLEYNYELENSKVQKKKNSKKKSKKKSNKKIILDYNNLPDKNVKKVWKSKRMREKKGPEIVKRKFNPRLPPPGNKFKNIKKKNNIEFNLNNDFPLL
jgi:hypothetical protein